MIFDLRLLRETARKWWQETQPETATAVMALTTRGERGKLKFYSFVIDNRMTWEATPNSDYICIMQDEELVFYKNGHVITVEIRRRKK